MRMMQRKWIRPLAGLTWLLVWQAAAMVLNAPVLLPSPLATIVALYRLAGTQAFWQSILLSLGRIMLGYVMAVALGILLGTLCSASGTANVLFSPVKTLIRSTPITSIIILVLLWLSIDRVPVFIVALTVLPIIWQSVQQGVIQVDAKLLEMTQAYAFSRGKRLRYLYVPSVLPYFYSACATAVGFAWKAGVAAEVIARPELSIGKNLQDAKVYLNTEELFAWTLAVVLLSLLLEQLLRQALFGKTKRGKGTNAAG